MSRKDFQLISGVPVSEILLDTRNPRIRDGSDQSDCISRILRKEDQLKTLMRDIAESGLTTMPILVRPNGNKWVVMDGNRRIAALKLLNDPKLCPVEGLKPFIDALRNKNINNISSKVDVLSSSNDESIAKEVLSRHSGAQGGAGQLSWNAYMRTVFQLNNGHPVDYKRPGQYALWAEKQGIVIDEDFPITSLQRFFTVGNLARLGFSIENDELKLILAEDVVESMAKIVMGDFSGEVGVDNVRSTEQADEYINTVRARVGLIDPPSSSIPTSSSPSEDPASNAAHPPAPVSVPTFSQGNTGGAMPAPSSPPNSTSSPVPRPPKTPMTNSWDRKRLFGTRAPQIPIPSDEKKATNIVVELRGLDVKTNPIAVAMLLRGLIELSEKYYRLRHSLQDANKLGKNITACATHMHGSGLITSSELDVVTRFSGNANLQDNLLHVEALQKIMHRETHHPSYQLVNTLWDNIAPFVKACWRS